MNRLKVWCKGIRFCSHTGNEPLTTFVIELDKNCFSTQYIDEKLGFFQKKFHLTGNQVRLLAARRPQLITYPEDKIKVNMFVLKEEMGFTPEEMKKILLDAPKVYTKS